MIIYQETPFTLFWQQFHFSFGGVILCFGFYTIPMVCFKKRDKLSIWKCVRFQCENENTKIFVCEMHSENISTTGLCVSKLSRDRAMIFYLLEFLNPQQFQICIKAFSITLLCFFFSFVKFIFRDACHTVPSIWPIYFVPCNTFSITNKHNLKYSTDSELNHQKRESIPIYIT